MFKFYTNKCFFLSILLLSCCQLTLSQTKDEKEARIGLDAFPKMAQELLNALPTKIKRIRYYKETDGDKESFETKFKLSKHWHSIEFDSLGKLEDIEVNINERELLEPIKNAIDKYLNENSETYDFIKIQEQYVYNNESSEDIFLTTVLESRTTIASNYEIIIALKSDKSWTLKEMTFSSDGQFLNSRNLQQDSYENIMH